jgi:hypothetical protein
MNKLIAWFELKWLAFQDWLESWKPCPKEQAGYNCHHRIMSNGQKECGKERNYWGGDHE